MKSKAFFISRLVSLDPTLDQDELKNMTVLKLLELIKLKKEPRPSEECECEYEEPDLATSILGCYS